MVVFKDITRLIGSLSHYVIKYSQGRDEKSLPCVFEAAFWPRVSHIGPADPT